MRCSKCGTDNAADARFCNHCATPLNRACPKCARLNAPDAKFCSQCAIALDGQAAVGSDASASPVVRRSVRLGPEPRDASAAFEGERKTVTALFADIKGSTELMEDLDPEEARAIIDPALKLMIDAVHRYDGYVVQSTGDGIFALFGAPLAHEDHPQRALYAALRLQEELKRYSAKVLAEGGTPIQGRVGINTGEVVVRSIQTGAGQVEYTPIGHTTNLASRMQTAAPVGSIAVSEATRRLCEGYFILNTLGATRVKGVSEPVHVYEVTGLGPLRTRLQRSAGRGLTKFVGREREMEALKHAAEQAKAGRGQIVAAMAEPGVGKSRLLYEFKATSRSGWMVLETFSVSHGRASAYLPVIDLLRNYFEIFAEDDERKRREKVAGKIAILDRTLEDTLPYIFGLLGIVEGDDPLAQMDGQVKKRRTLEAIKRILLRESLNQPLMVICEDLHWMDAESQALLNLFADAIANARVLLVVNYRPEYRHEWGHKTYYMQLRLDPLGKESADEMLGALLGGSGTELAALKRLIIQKSEGNPFFMEEMVRNLFEEGALVRNGEVKLARSLSAIRVPPMVQAILAARIDRLPPEEKDFMQTLAVLGKEFTFSQLKAAAAKTDSELERMLSDLQLAEFIYEQPATGDIEYTFKHALTQEVAYNSILVDRRKQIHERAAQAIESLFAASLADHYEDLARHYGRGGNSPKAIEYLQLAGQQAAQRSANAEAVNYFTSALEILKPLPDTPHRAQQELVLLTMLGPALIATKGNAALEVGAVYERALELSRQAGEDAQLFPILFGLRSFQLVQGELRSAFDLGEQLLSLAEKIQDSALILEARLAQGNTHFILGQFVPALAHLEQVAALYDARKHHVHAFSYGLDPGVFCLHRIAMIVELLGHPDSSLKRIQEAFTLAQEQGHSFGIAITLMVASGIHRIRGEWQAAQMQAEAAMELCTEQGFANLLGQATIFRGATIAKQGRGDEGIALIREGLAACSATGAVLFQSQFLFLLAEACEGAMRLKEGLTALAEATAIVERTGERCYEAELHRMKGELMLKQFTMQDLASNLQQETETSFRQAIEIARRQGARLWELRATTSLARLLAKQGRREEARAMLVEIYGWFTEGFDTADLKDAKALLDELGN